MKKFLCVDIGTTSLKTALVSEKGQVLSFIRTGFENQNPDKISLEWKKAFSLSVEYIKRDFFKSENENKTGEKISVDAVAVSGNGPTVVGESGNTVLWNLQVEQKLLNRIPKEFSSSLFLPKLVLYKEKFLSENKKEKLFSGPEYLIFCLTENHITILPEERYKTAYWDDNALKSIGISPDSLGKFVFPGFNAGGITMTASDLFNIKKDVPVIACGPDFIAAMAGTNTLSQGKLCDCAGSSEGINLCTSKPFFADGIRTLPSMIPGLWNEAILKQSSGKSFVECKTREEEKQKRKISYEEFIELCFSDKKSEGYKKMTALAEFVKDAVSKLKTEAEKNGIKTDDVMMVTGGQANSEKWLSLKADIAGIKLSVTDSADAELIGDAVLASYGLKLYNSINEAADNIVTQKKIFVPKK